MRRWLSFLIVMLLAACEDGSRRESSSGRFVAVLFHDNSSGHDMLGIRIEDGYGHVLLSPTDRWSARHRVEDEWDAEERLWLWSSDVGTSVWARHDTPTETGGNWAALTESESNTLRPPTRIGELSRR